MPAFDCEASVLLKEVRRILKERLAADARESLIDMYENGCYFPPEVADLIDEELLPAIEKVLDAYDCDPTDDEFGGEPPLSADERWQIAHQEHLEAHR